MPLTPPKIFIVTGGVEGELGGLGGRQAALVQGGAMRKGKRCGLGWGAAVRTPRWWGRGGRRDALQRPSTGCGDRSVAREEQGPRITYIFGSYTEGGREGRGQSRGDDDHFRLDLKGLKATQTLYMFSTAGAGEGGGWVAKGHEGGLWRVCFDPLGWRDGTGLPLRWCVGRFKVRRDGSALGQATGGKHECGSLDLEGP